MDIFRHIDVQQPK
jgi:predicted transglutaminase-like protease